MPKYSLISGNDKIIIAFLNGNSRIQRVVLDKKPKRLSYALSRRIKFCGLEGIESYSVNGDLYLEIKNPSLREINLLKYNNIIEDIERRRKSKANKKAKGHYVLSEIRSVESQEDLLSKIRNTVSVICSDFSEADQKFMIDEVYNRLKNGTDVNRSYAVQTAVVIYLLSKCPANSGTPLRFKELHSRLLKIEPGISRIAFYDLFLHFKELGIKTCRVTYEMALNSRKDFLSRLAKDKDIPQIVIDDTIKSAVEICNSPALKRSVMGRDPYVVAASIVYYTKKLQRYVSQREICDMFGVTAVSLRKITEILDDLFGVVENQEKINKGGTIVMKVCPVCGKSFASMKSEYKKYCSPSCSYKRASCKFDERELSIFTEKGSDQISIRKEVKPIKKEDLFSFLDEQCKLPRIILHGKIKLNNFYFFLKDNSFFEHGISYRKWIGLQDIQMVGIVREWCKEYATIHNAKAYFSLHNFAGLGTVKFYK